MTPVPSPPAPPVAPPSAPFLVSRIFLPFALGYYLSYLLRTVNAVISPDLTRELGLNAADLGLLTSTYFFAFGLAQIPVGIALDRFGPRRVESALLLITALGATLFALGEDLPVLAGARGLIGFGVSACLMGGLKGFTLWFPRERLASLTGYIMSGGALGAVTASAPLEAALPFIGWRGAFWAVAVLAAGIAALIFFAMPEKSSGHGGGDLQAALRGVKEVLSARRFWSFSGQAAFFTGGFMALQGLWAVPWLMQVNGYSRAVAADHLFWLNLGMLAGQLSIGAWATRLAARGITPLRLMQGGLFLTMLVEALIIARLGPTQPLWCLLGIVSATGAQMYGVVAGLFPLHLSGRVTTSINLMAFVGAFAVQWGLGGLLDGLRAGGMSAATSLEVAFLILLAAQAASFVPLSRAGRYTPVH
ncbi:MAG TPA: MFS transporter [Zoogloea sp.]|uniref:MFS transporter n=1 Tax=Zoogloea sp. TaxID=49181 RepID=UPI002B959913|nr:MFS transporter [Zoogloea sp.]HMV18520.1 MFS transporter [Rhodocyclaceae bacterium]HMV64229.1 MFS transporter [Rhodocyclaceae bacterium]HMW53117.1 MFS transporter [Rhodocyclaceae bacterium]HMZ77208.1 MFS transporter [Rhodocyclaceae bacterium]HNA68869.1 MFS transporter [Rhodocyclaceae bacterium]